MGSFKIISYKSGNSRERNKKKKINKTQRLLVVKLSEVQKLEITKAKSQNYVIVKVKQPIYWHMRTRFLAKTFSILIYLNLESQNKNEKLEITSIIFQSKRTCLRKPQGFFVHVIHHLSEHLYVPQMFQS